MALIGVRLGEILGFKWCDIDLECRECLVVRSPQKTEDGLSLVESSHFAASDDGSRLDRRGNPAKEMYSVMCTIFPFLI